MLLHLHCIIFVVMHVCNYYLDAMSVAAYNITGAIKLSFCMENASQRAELLVLKIPIKKTPAEYFVH